MKRTFRLLLFILTVTIVSAFGQNAVEPFDRYAEAARAAWGLPGMSIVVVKDGKVVMSKGYGTREVGKGDRVDNETLFGAMSTTKAMVAVAMGILVDEGKVNWNDKVTKHLPNFKLGDPYLTNELTVRDLFTHNTGLPNADFLWALGAENSSDEIVSRMQYAKPAYNIRGGFVYHNVMYGVAGKVIEKASGMPWAQFMTTRVFAPLGMKSTFPSISASSAYTNKSKAHFSIKNELRTIPEMSVDAVGPAGAVWTTADDAGLWMIFMLGDGKPLLKESTLNEILKPQVILPSTFYPSFRLTKPRWTTYGLGWFQHDYRGEMVNFHTGSLTGRIAIVGLLREKRMGVFIFGNADHIEVRHPLMYKAFDVFGFGDPNGRDWAAEMKPLYDGIDAEQAKAVESARAARKTDTVPSVSLESYAGEYSDPFYGKANVTFSDGKLRLLIGRDLSGELRHWQNDSFLVAWNQEWRGEQVISFVVDKTAGRVTGINTGFGWLARVASK